jgi:hypothetical protein
VSLIPEAALAGLSVLNVNAGDLKFDLTSASEEEKATAAKVITDMLKAGYTILVEDDDKQLVPVKAFDATKMLYMVEDRRPVKVRGKTGPKKGSKRKGIPITSTKATAIGRAAGG